MTLRPLRNLWPDRVVGRAVVASGLLLAACGSSSPGVNDGPLGGGGFGGGFCAPVRPGGSLAVGEAFTNKGNQAAQIAKVTLWHSRHLQLLSAWALPVGNQGSVGALDWPPSLSEVPNWDIRVPAVGARIPSRAHWQIVLRLVPSGSRTGSAAAVTVNYEEAGTMFVMRQPYSLTVTTGRCS
jgi:hypothetical protein